MKRKQIIFLDIDGVITSSRCNGYYDFDLWAVHFILFCCKNSNTKIVMSSAWRMIPEAKEWFTDLFGEFLHEDWRTGDLDHRGKEISEWLAKHPEIEHYVVIDDSSFDIVELHRNNLVITSSEDGMLWRHMVQIRKMLGIQADMPARQEIEVKDVCFDSIREAARREQSEQQQAAEDAMKHARQLVQEAADEVVDISFTKV